MTIDQIADDSYARTADLIDQARLPADDLRRMLTESDEALRRMRAEDYPPDRIAPVIGGRNAIADALAVQLDPPGTYPNEATS